MAMQKFQSVCKIKAHKSVTEIDLFISYFYSVLGTAPSLKLVLVFLRHYFGNFPSWHFASELALVVVVLIDVVEVETVVVDVVKELTVLLEEEEMKVLVEVMVQFFSPDT